MLRIKNTRKLAHLIRSVGSEFLFVQNTRSEDFEEIVERFSAHASLVTADLRFTKGRCDETQSYNAVVIAEDTHTPLNVIYQRVNTYVETHRVVFLADKNTAKRVKKQFDVEKKCKLGETQALLLPTQRPVPVDVETNDFTYTYREEELRFKTEQGLFSFDGVDTGTDFLLQHIPLEPGKSVLDFACGYGAIGLSIAKERPENHVLMVDSDSRAVRCAKRNAELNDIRNVDIQQRYLLEGVREQSADIIVSNPPTHTPKREVQLVFSQLHATLRSGGEAWMVISKAVEYQRYSTMFFDSRIAKQNDHYKIVRLKKGGL